MNHDLQQLLATGCADCNSDQTMTEVAAGVFVLGIAHDSSCPWWTAEKKATGR